MGYDGNDVSEGTDTNKTAGFRECIICHYCYFFKTNFRFQQKVCNGCHDMTQKFMSFNDFTVVIVERNDYTIHFESLNKSEVLFNRTKNANLSEKGTIKIMKKINYLL